MRGAFFWRRADLRGHPGIDHPNSPASILEVRGLMVDVKAVKKQILESDSGAKEGRSKKEKLGTDEGYSRA
jgi:hypothetical protein